MAITFEELKKNSETQSKQEPVTFESLQPQEIKEEPKIQPITFESIKKEKEENEIGVGENIYRTAIGALRDVAQGTIDFSEWIESPFDLITPDKYKGGVVKTEEDGYQVLYGDEYKEAKTRMQSQGLKVVDLPKVCYSIFKIKNAYSYFKDRKRYRDCCKRCISRTTSFFSL
jgi:hypothetical protein